MNKYYFGVDIGGTHTKFGMFTEGGDLICKWREDTPQKDGGRYVFDAVSDSILKKCADEGISPDQVCGIGLGLPGPADENGIVNGCVNLGWKGLIDVPFEIEKRTGIRAAAGNDATLAAFGEYHANINARGKNTVFMTIGTGIGGGLIAGDRILAGAHGAAGEIGHIKVSAPDAKPCNCGRNGCLEQYASATGIVALMKEELMANDYPSILRDLENIESKDVTEAAKACDPAAVRVMEKVFGYLGEAIAAMCCVFDPECVIIGGGVSAAGQFLLDGIEKSFKEKCFHACEGTAFYLAKLGNDAGIYGAFNLIRGIIIGS